MQEVSDFIVVAPVGLVADAERAGERLIGHLATRFPHYNFRIESFGGFADREEFTIIPIMNRKPRAGERKDPDELMLLRPLDPRVIPQIREALREFRFEAVAAN